MERCPVCGTGFDPLRPYDADTLLDALTGAARRGACTREHAAKVRRVRAGYRRWVLAREAEQERAHALAAGLERDGQLPLIFELGLDRV